jgi:FlaA1/EpsC-like NDP-sugar epimerase
MPNKQAFSVVLYRYRRLLIAALHLGLFACSNYLAFSLRFDGHVPELEWRLFVGTLPLLVVVRGTGFIPFRLYEGLWRYAGIWDLRNIIGAVLTTSLALFLIIHPVLGLTGYPRAVFIIDALLLVSLVGGVRLTRRVLRQLSPHQGSRRVLIYGAGDAGEMILRDMRNNPAQFHPVGFVDDNRAKAGLRIHGLPVLGGHENLASILEQVSPQEILVAIPSASPAAIRSILRSLEPYKIPISTLPKLIEVTDGQVSVSQIRSLKIEDLLARAPVGLQAAPLARLLKGKRILVTGAGGSIGSELCRQIASLGPENLTLLDRYENGLFDVANDLADMSNCCPVRAVIGDITDEGRLEAVMADCRPAIVFHAAAHKHVPLMELNPCEAVKNNVLGTRRVMQAAAAYGAERFVLISSDKAVNPTSVMGTTKRVAEMLIQATGKSGPTTFLAVRFGNVLASTGSVVPRFLQQIKNGGPVTVTHPEMRRYFMLIPEAVQLVLHAAALAEAGAVYVLEMGDEVKVLDLARNLIRLSGFVPEEEIPIVFTGLRPGEKLFEELVGDNERASPSGVENILQVSPNASPRLDLLSFEIAELERLAREGDESATLRQLSKIVSSFHGAPSHAEATVP